MTESVPSSTAFSQDKIKLFICNWLNDNKTEFNRSEKERQLIEDLQENFDIDFETAYLFTAEALDLTQEQIDTYLVKSQRDIQEESIDKKCILDQNDPEEPNLVNTLASTDDSTIDKIPMEPLGVDQNLVISEQDILHFLGKEPVLSLNFRHKYFKLVDDEFSTVRGKTLYYKAFDYEGGKHKLIRGDLIRITVQKRFFCFCELLDIQLKKISNCSLEFLKKDAECEKITVNSYDDFVRGLNSLRDPRWAQATVDSYVTVLLLKKIVVKSIDKIDPMGTQQINFSLVNTQTDIQDQNTTIDKKCILDQVPGKNDLVNSQSESTYTQTIDKTSIDKKKHVEPSSTIDKNLVNTQIDIQDTIDKMKEIKIPEHLIHILLPQAEDKEVLKLVKRVKGKGEIEFFISLDRLKYLKRYKTCGDKTCRCTKGHKHGPYIIAYWWDPKEKRQKQKHIGRAA